MYDAEVDREVVYTVSELLGGLARLLEERVGRVWVVGEISDVHVARSGWGALVERVGPGFGPASMVLR